VWVFLGQLAHQVGEPVGDGVELVLDGLVGPFLHVLQRCDEKERHDRRHGIDDQLPGVDVRKQEVRRRPVRFQNRGVTETLTRDQFRPGRHARRRRGHDFDRPPAS